MRSERLFPSMGAYTEVMNTLSKYGHGSLVTRILDLIKNKEWLSSGKRWNVFIETIVFYAPLPDLRVLVCNCVSRGEVEAPRLLLKQLVKNNGVDRFVLAMYTLACIEQGQSLTDVLEDLKTDVSMIADPQVLHLLLVWCILTCKVAVYSQVLSCCPEQVAVQASS